nr:hypothetical protein [Kofleriaceae bacterium]
MRRLWLTVTTLALPLGACLDFDFHSEGTRVTATTSLAMATDTPANPDGFDTDVSICGGPSDLLSCNEDNDTFVVAMGDYSEAASEGFLSFGVLDASFDGDPSNQTLGVTRGDGAYGSVVVPPAIDLTGPSGSIHGGDAIQLAWTPAGDDVMRWQGSVTCGSAAPVDAHGGALRDLGWAHLHTDEFPTSQPGPCTATIVVLRTRTGTMDARYGSDSSISAEMSTELQVDLAD